MLVASPRLEDFPTVPSRHPSYTGELITGKMFLHAEEAQNIGIEGRGIIAGGGDTWVEGPYGSPSFHFRPRLLHFVACENVQIRGVTFRNSGSWTLSFLECRDIAITNCIVSSNASGIKIGTESAGAFEDFVVQNCTVFDTRCEALAILTVDGARIERVSISNITLRNIKGDALLVRLGARRRTYRSGVSAKTGARKDVLIAQGQGTRIADLGCALSGLPAALLENVVLRDINLEFAVLGTPVVAGRAVPENPKGYPGAGLFGKLPAYGFFIRHAKNVVLENVRTSFVADDHRPAVVCDDVDGLAVTHLNARVLSGIEPLDLVNTRRIDLGFVPPASTGKMPR